MLVLASKISKRRKWKHEGRVLSSPELSCLFSLAAEVSMNTTQRNTQHPLPLFSLVSTFFDPFSQKRGVKKKVNKSFLISLLSTCPCLCNAMLSTVITTYT